MIKIEDTFEDRCRREKLVKKRVATLTRKLRELLAVGSKICIPIGTEYYLKECELFLGEIENLYRGA